MRLGGAAAGTSSLGFRGGRWQVAGVDFVGEADSLMGAIAEGLIRGVAAAAERELRAAGQAEGLAVGVEDFEIAFDAERAVVPCGDLG